MQKRKLLKRLPLRHKLLSPQNFLISIYLKQTGKAFPPCGRLFSFTTTKRTHKKNTTLSLYSHYDKTGLTPPPASDSLHHRNNMGHYLRMDKTANCSRYIACPNLYPAVRHGLRADARLLADRKKANPPPMALPIVEGRNADGSTGHHGGQHLLLG